MCTETLRFLAVAQSWLQLSQARQASMLNGPASYAMRAGDGLSSSALMSTGIASASASEPSSKALGSQEVDLDEEGRASEETYRDVPESSILLMQSLKEQQSDMQRSFEVFADMLGIVLEKLSKVERRVLDGEARYERSTDIEQLHHVSASSRNVHFQSDTREVIVNLDQTDMEIAENDPAAISSYESGASSVFEARLVNEGGTGRNGAVHKDRPVTAPMSLRLPTPLPSSALANGYHAVTPTGADAGSEMDGQTPVTFPSRSVVDDVQHQADLEMPNHRRSGNGLAASVATSDVASILRGVTNTLNVITGRQGAASGTTSTSPAQMASAGDRWKRVDVRSGRRNSVTNAMTELMTDKKDKPISQRARFGGFCGIIIVVDSVLIALETDDTARNGEVLPFYRLTGYIFTCWYVFEWTLRLVQTRPKKKFFTRKDEAAWNIFDMLLISASMLDILFQQLDFIRLRVVAVGRVLRALRLFRVIRVLRIIRFMTFMREFHKLVLCLASSIQTLLCAMCLMTFVIFCFSVMFVQLVTQHLNVTPDYVPSTIEEKAVRDAFGSVGKSMISLYMSITAGQNWGEIADLLLWIDPAVRACFFFFLALAIYGLTNVVTAVFVESAMQATQQYRDLRVQEMMLKERANVKHMKEIFKSIDADNSGAISLEEMQAYMGDESLQLQEYFEALDLSASDTHTLFALLDVDNSGEVDIEEFCDGCMRLGGTAKSFDMNCMWYEQRRTNRELLKFIQHACMCLHSLTKNSSVSETHAQDLLSAIEGSRKLLAKRPRPTQGDGRAAVAAASRRGSDPQKGRVKVTQVIEQREPLSNAVSSSSTGSASVVPVRALPPTPEETPSSPAMQVRGGGQAARQAGEVWGWL